MKLAMNVFSESWLLEAGDKSEEVSMKRGHVKTKNTPEGKRHL